MDSDQQEGCSVSDCQHSKFEASVHVVRVTENKGRDFTGRLFLDVTAHCVVCKQPVVFPNLLAGSQPERAIRSWDGREARIPASIAFNKVA